MDAFRPLPEIAEIRSTPMVIPGIPNRYQQGVARHPRMVTIPLGCADTHRLLSNRN